MYDNFSCGLPQRRDGHGGSWRFGDAALPTLRVAPEHYPAFADAAHSRMRNLNDAVSLALEVRKLSLLSAFLLAAIVICTGIWLVIFVKVEQLMRLADHQTSEHVLTVMELHGELDALNQQLLQISSTLDGVRSGIERSTRRADAHVNTASDDQDRISLHRDEQQRLDPTTEVTGDSSELR